MSSSSFSLYALAFLSLSLLASTTPTDARKELGLFPTRDANILKHDPLANASKVVEKPFRFPSLSDVDSFGPNAQNVAQYAGYVQLSQNSTARVFYYMVKSRSTNKGKVPFIVHSTGGPGFSSSLAVFYGNGPFRFTNNLSVYRNAHGWDTFADILFVDLPVGTGFSYSTDETDIPKTTEQAAADFYEFLQAFLEEHPELANSDLYLSVESYAGRYALGLAAQIHNNQRIHINLKGMMLSTGWISPALQFLAYSDYAKTMRLVSPGQWNQMRSSFWWCYQEVQKSCNGNNYNWTGCAQANEHCNNILWDNIITPMKGKNYYDITKMCDQKTSLCYDFSNMEHFLNQQSVKEALGVDECVKFVSWSSKVNGAMAGDVMRSFENHIPLLLQNGIKILVYTGENDLICNSIGNLNWMTDMNWWGRFSFNSAPYVLFKVNGMVAGKRKSNGLLSYANVMNAGHFVNMDQPEVTRQMVWRWMNDIPL